MLRFASFAVVACGMLATSCTREPARSPYPPAPGPYAASPYPNGAPPGAYPNGYPGTQTYPNGAPPGAYPNGYPAPPPNAQMPPPAPTSAVPATGSPLPPFPFPFPQFPGLPIPTMPNGSAPSGTSPLPGAPIFGDPINALDITYLRQRAHAVLAELSAALPANQRSMIAAVPLVVDDTPGEVNAFAACTKNGALMAITDGLLEISAQMARAKATDELFGTAKLQEYVKLVSQHQQPKQPIVRPALGFFEPSQDGDGRKVARQHDLLDEQLAFILGHELAHHYLQHTGCVGPQSASVTPADIGRLLSNAVPVFNQPNELAADTQGVTSLLNAGRARAGQRWNEEGAMLTLNFFVALMQMDPADRVLFAFQGSHPPPELRIPIVQQTANQWRATGGAASGFPLPFPFPGG